MGFKTSSFCGVNLRTSVYVFSFWLNNDFVWEEGNGRMDRNYIKIFCFVWKIFAYGSKILTL